MSEIIHREKKAVNLIAQSARRDILMGGITVAAIVLFAGTGSSVMVQALRKMLGNGGGADNVLGIALLLNIALILFGWRRYTDLQKEVEERTAAEERAHILAMRDPLASARTPLSPRFVLAAQAALVALIFVAASAPDTVWLALSLAFTLVFLAAVALRGAAAVASCAPAPRGWAENHHRPPS